jgi:hypothetical protein
MTGSMLQHTAVGAAIAVIPLTTDTPCHLSTAPMSDTAVSLGMEFIDALSWYTRSQSNWQVPMANWNWAVHPTLIHTCVLQLTRICATCYQQPNNWH